VKTQNLKKIKKGEKNQVVKSSIKNIPAKLHVNTGPKNKILFGLASVLYKALNERSCSKNTKS